MNKFSAILLATVFSLPVYAQQQETPPPTMFKNMVVCGDATVCPWQRGTSIASITNSATATADFWYAIGGASSSITISQQTQTGINGFTKAIQFQRANANADTAAVHLGQVFDTADFGTSLQGKTVCLSFDSLAGSTFSANGATLTYNMISGTGSNQGYASMVAGTWTGTATFGTGTVTEATTSQNAQKCAQVPSNATEVGIDFTFTPVGTAGANDYVQLLRVQFEAINPNVPFTKAVATTFENRAAMTELWLAQSRAYVLAEPAANKIVSIGNAETSTQCDVPITFPRPMRATPGTPTVSSVSSGTTWQALANGVQANLSAIALYNTATQTQYVSSLKLTTSGMTAGQACGLVGKGGSASITFSADLL